MGTSGSGFRGHVITVTLVVAVALGWLVVLLRAGGGLPSLDHPYTVRALVPTAASLASNARVTMAGAQVGRVVSVERRGFGALVKLELDDGDVTPIPADSRIAIRQRTPVGENYVSIERGTERRTLASGDVLPVSQGDEYVDVDQVLSLLQGHTRRRARALIQGFGGALAGRGEQLNALLDTTGRTLTASGKVTDVLSRDREQVAQLVEQFGDIARAVAQRGTAMRTFARTGLQTFRAIAGRDVALRAWLRELPATLTQVRTTSTTLGAVTGRVAPVLSDLAQAVRGLQPAVDELRPAAGEGRAIISRLGAAAPPLQLTLTRLRALATPLAAATPAVRSSLCQLNPLLRYLRPYTPDVVATAVGLGAASQSYDALGHLMRATPVITEQALVGLPPQAHEAALTLMRSGLLSKTRELGYDPYPRPGSLGANPDGDGVLGPSQVKKHYPRIQPDC